MIKKGLVLFGYDKPNRYSWSILMGYLENNSQLMENYDFIALPFQLYKSPQHSSKIKEIPFQNYDFVVLAFSLLSIQMNQFKEFSKSTPYFFNQFHPKIFTVAGGPHVTASPQEFQNLNVDFLIPGEGEIGFSQLLHTLYNASQDLLNYPMLNGVIQLKPQYSPGLPAKIIELGVTPSFSEKFRLFGPIEISRGCPYRCKFCQTGCSSNKMRHVPIQTILQNVKRASEIKFDKVWFLTPNAFAYGSPNGITPNIEAVQELLTGISQKNSIKGIYFGTFPSEVRPESVTREMLEIVTPLMTNRKLLIGAQTASNRLLKSIARGHNIEDVITAVDLMDEFGIGAEIDFIFGLPGEIEEDIQANISFFNQVLTNKVKNVRIHTHTFMPLPGTPFENENPGIIDPRISHIIGKLAKAGKAYGEYQAQAGLVKTRYDQK
ncbi:TIGR04013 family B12-binding domain/radical SAM domain-containing protein [Candidatus Lokiarchaeum ossiferum]